jgi:CDP-4-dehydro-6-deoxyglucose reductase, E1
VGSSVSLPSYVYSCEDFVPGKTRVQYSGPFFDHHEIDAATQALISGRWLSSGEQVVRFQNEFGRRFRTKNCLMVNSGSSANLVMIAALKKRYGWKIGDGVIVSPVGFPTTIAPIVQNGLWPFFADIELKTLNFDLDHVEKLLLTARQMKKKIAAIFISPVLGNPPDMDRLLKLSVQYDVKLVADNCDSLGTTWNGHYWHEMCYAWSTSFYPAHHISTGEGGMVCSNDPETIDLARSISWWGRDCYCVGAANLLPCGTCNKRFSDWLGDGTEIDHRYLFTNLGYNLKPLDLQGAIGLEQLKKFDEIETKRRHHAGLIEKFFDGIPGVRTARRWASADPCWFGVPLICESRKIKENLIRHIETNLVQTRQYFAGNILRHPGYSHLGKAADYPNAQQALDRVFFLGCPPQYTQSVLDYVSQVVREWKPCKP